MRTLHAVEGELGVVLLGLFVSRIGVGVRHLGGFARGSNEERVPLADDTGECYNAEDVTEGGIVSINRNWEKDEPKEMERMAYPCSGVTVMEAMMIEVDGDE